jgi:hypothetical protein
LEWLEKTGAKGLDASRLTFGMDEDMLGAWAQQDYKVNDVLFEVPLSCLYGMDNVRTSSEMARRIRAAAASKLGDPSRCTSELLIWLGMIEARNDKSHHHYVYMQSLDLEMTPNILEWPEQLVKIFTRLRPQMTTDVDSMLDRYMELLDLARDDVEGASDWLPRSIYNRKSLSWAYGHYVSRRYPGKYSKFGSAVDKNSTDGRETRLGELGILVPALDILNHGDSSVEWLRFNTTDSHLQVICMQPRKKGQQLWSNYGSVSNERLLFAYGFAIKDNDNDEVALHLKLGTNTGDGTGIVVDHGVFHLGRGGTAGVPPELWTALKSLREDDDDGGDGAAVEIDEFELGLLRNFVGRLRQKHTSPEIADLLQEAAGAQGASDTRLLWTKYYISGQLEVLDELIADLDAMTPQEEDEDEDEDEGDKF